MSKEINIEDVEGLIPTTALEIETPKGVVKIGDTVTALGNDYEVKEVQSDMIISTKANGEKIAVPPKLVEAITQKKE